MKIVADKNLALLSSDIPPGVEVNRLDGRTLSNTQLRDADVLLVRSVTAVNAALLQGSDVKFVGTATAGVDHLDRDYLEREGIVYCSAPGSNADAVVDYCLAALAHGVLALGLELSSARVGIVGAGNVGSRLAERLQQLGCSVLLNDPPLQDQGKTEVAGLPLQSLEDMAGCQVISLHVPFTEQGAHATGNLIDEAFLRRLQPDSLLINTCRGEVIEEAPLRSLVGSGQVNTVIDVWRGEPNIDKELAQKVTLSTPHIAGYSGKAKRNGVEQVLAQLWRFALAEGLLDALPRPEASENSKADEVLSVTGDGSCWQLIQQVLPLPAISESFKHSLADASTGNAFDAMRAQMKQRREFSEYQIAASDLSSEQLQQFTGAGFQVLR